MNGCRCAVRNARLLRIRTVESSPREMSIAKKRIDQNDEKGRRPRISGYTMNANAVAASKISRQCLSEIISVTY